MNMSIEFPKNELNLEFRSGIVRFMSLYDVSSQS